MTPFLPGKVVDTYHEIGCGVDYGIQARHVLLDDGQIFAWARLWNVYELMFGFAGFIIVGGITGVIAAVVTHVHRQRWHHELNIVSEPN